MNAGQYEGMMRVLTEIRNRLPAPERAQPQPARNAAQPPHTRYLYTEGERGGASIALREVLEALDAWVVGARENHEALGHSSEPYGEECWRSFAPSDFRRMVIDAAREIGLTDFELPPDPAERRQR